MESPKPVVHFIPRHAFCMKDALEILPPGGSFGARPARQYLFDGWCGLPRHEIVGYPASRDRF